MMIQLFRLDSETCSILIDYAINCTKGQRVYNFCLSFFFHVANLISDTGKQWKILWFTRILNNENSSIPENRFSLHNQNKFSLQESSIANISLIFSFAGINTKNVLSHTQNFMVMIKNYPQKKVQLYKLSFSTVSLE